MTKQITVTPVETLFRLLELARLQGKAGDALAFALAWLVIGKLSSQGHISIVAWRTQQDPDQMLATIQKMDVLPVVREALSRALEDQTVGIQDEAVYLLKQLIDAIPSTRWDLRDAAWVAAARSRLGTDSRPAYDPAVCDLMVASLQIEPGESVWVPFDPSGQFTVRLVCAGAQVWRSGPGYDSPELTALLLALEDDPHAAERVKFARFAPDAHHAPAKCLVAAPMGMKVPRTTEWRKWEHIQHGGRTLWITPEETDRSDAWAVAAMWPAVAKRAVFLASPSLLFAQGQEHRLRKALLVDKPGNMVEASVSLPSGVLSVTSIAPCLLVLDAQAQRGRIRMIDVSGADNPGGLKHRLGKDLDAAAAARLLTTDVRSPWLADGIELREIEEHDFSLMPQRYLRRVEGLPGVRCSMGDLVTQTVRSPVPTKDVNGWAVWEIGIPSLDQWRPISSGYERSMRITPRKAGEALLREGDLVVSIKGTVGRVGIVGAIPGTYEEARKRSVTAVLVGEPIQGTDEPRSAAAVAAASCIALRVDRQKVLPEYLLLYLRSDDFKRQLDALRVGATIAHITPAALLSGVQVPLLPLDEQQRICERHKALCEMEEQVEHLQRQMRETQHARFLISTTN